MHAGVGAGILAFLRVWRFVLVVVTAVCVGPSVSVRPAMLLDFCRWFGVVDVPCCRQQRNLPVVIPAKAGIQGFTAA
ncbi:hypothetical protein AZ78_0087 [Lysobacter capsici AZ78]|uniref:Uncharacterized protein n=1 Tax=Lysobacter capsici AZ78 TaxID=1444315 RepID=A0A125U0A8_9GAMM|nr:hypothetical protein AZ78_0087 [Lysobacter capsici AZ78]